MKGWKSLNSNYWLKCHIMTGVKTNVITACEISKSHDSPMFPSLVQTTAQNFQIKEIAADKAYSSRKNFDLIDSLGGTALIPFKDKAVFRSDNELRNKMFHYFSFHRDEFFARYHMRSNVESTFAAIKAKFCSHVRSKTLKAQENEVLCKVLCHNVCCLI
ncbi:transposase [Candidatus Acetothermia bacterium]|nr:transposase [Candidatus Acetothermia bacterium]MBI3643503.1 transposase [Candidatus Acetothermia bacterium]